MASMEAIWLLVTAIAPIAWGATYFVTHEFLPANAPLWGSAIRALPAGVLLLAVGRRLPHGRWWLRSLVLGVLNVAAFFLLVYVAATLLPTSVASTVTATSPIAIMVFAWLLLDQRPGSRAIIGALAGFAGVALLVFTGATAVDARGVLASLAAMACSSAGYSLSTRWGRDVDLLSSTAWQLLAGGALLVPVALLVEGPPPPIDARQALGFGYVSVVATASAYVAWFAGLRRLRAATVGLIGLLNPVTGVLLGLGVAGEALTVRQLLGLGAIAVGIALGTARRDARTRAQGRPYRRYGIPPRHHTQVWVPCRSAAASFDLGVRGSRDDPDIKEIDDGEVHADHARHGRIRREDAGDALRADARNSGSLQ